MSQCDTNINIYDALIAHVPRYYIAKYEVISHLFYNNDHRTIQLSNINAQINYDDLRDEFEDMLDRVHQWLMSDQYTRSMGDLEELRSINCIYEIIHDYVSSDVANKADNTDDVAKAECYDPRNCHDSHDCRDRGEEYDTLDYDDAYDSHNDSGYDSDRYRDRNSGRNYYTSDQSLRRNYYT